MKIFITGGTGWIGSQIIRELRAANHEVTALARSTRAAEHVTRLGATPRAGDITDRDGLRAAAREADAAIHCAFDHRFAASDLIGALLVRMTRSPWFARISRAGRTDLRAIAALVDGLAESASPHKVLLTTGPIAGLTAGKVGTETDTLDPSAFGGIRIASELATIAAARRGVKSASIRLPPSVHGDGDTGFVPQLAASAKKIGAAVYLGSGANRWSAVHRDDAAVLYRLAMEGLADQRVPAGSVLHGVAEQGIPFRELATALGDRLGLATESRAKSPYPMFLGMVAALDIVASSELTQKLTGWHPTQAGLISDLSAQQLGRA